MDGSQARALVAAAKRALHPVRRAQNSHHNVSAAVLARDGRVFTGIDVFHFTGGACAELVALGTAVGAGVEIAELVGCVAVKRLPRDEEGGGPGDELDEEADCAAMTVLNPCGRCRQQLLDLNGRIQVVVIAGDGTEKVVGVSELLPYAYMWNAGQKKKRRAVEGLPEGLEEKKG